MPIVTIKSQGLSQRQYNSLRGLLSSRKNLYFNERDNVIVYQNIPRQEMMIARMFIQKVYHNEAGSGERRYDIYIKLEQRRTPLPLFEDISKRIETNPKTITISERDPRYYAEGEVKRYRRPRRKPKLD